MPERDDLEEGATPSEAQEKKPTLRSTLQDRHRYTGEELSENLAAWSARRAEEREALRQAPPEVRAGRVRRRAMLSMAVLLASGVVGGLVADNRLQHRASVAQQQVPALEAELEEVSAVPEDGVTAEGLDGLIEVATSQAQEVADEQNVFADLYRESTTADVPQDGTPDEASLQVPEQRRKIAPYFDPDSFVAPDDEAYQWSTASSFDVVSQVDPRYEWYISYDDDAASDPKSYGWEVSSVMPDLQAMERQGRADVAAVTWVNRRGEGGPVLAWAGAGFTRDGDTGRFSDLQVVVTTDGQASLPRWSQKDEDTSLPDLPSDIRDEGDDDE